MTQLNAPQRRAVRYVDGPCLVLAGAGSGKTSVITHKIAYLIEGCGIPARNIAAVTFTNKAAREMKERASRLVKGKAARGLIVSTFHNLGLRIIRAEYRKLGFKAGFSIFDSEDARAVLKEIMIKHDDLDSDHLDRVQNQISQWKNDLVTPEDALGLAQSDGEAAFARIYQGYHQALSAYNALDFDDLIGLPVQLFSSEPDVLARWRQRVRYLLVDEYQDTNNSQYRLVKQLVGDRHCLTVVGDDDQSIYAWRGANPENLAQLQRDFPTLAVIKLEQNYRSTSRILKAANHLIQFNPHVFDKTLWSEMGMGEPIRIIRCSNDDAEAERVATEILHQRLGRGIKFRDFAVLYRGNHQSKLLELKLQQHQIPYNISGGTSFFARAEIKDIMAYLRLVVNPDDDNAFLRIVNTPRRQIGTSTLQTLGHYASQREISLYAAAQEFGLQQQLPVPAMQRLEKFVATIEYTRQASAEHDPVRILRELVEDIDYEGWLHQNASSGKVAERRMENVHFLLGSIQKMLEKDEGDEVDLQGAIAKLILQDLLDRQEEEDESDRVQLMTLHAAKGLEFPHVFVLGLEENLLPHANSVADGNVEEERRLAYVGVTRAQRTLTLTLAAKRKQFGEVIESTPSRFLEELPQEDVTREGFAEDSSPERNKDRGSETLANLRDLLA
ncbi:DNA helicase Rep [Gilvimarinus sp. F26214L]|uniref:DNA helicase Rep n=1 Tax=Gilvimarinus sp. DZF01 TaxID=3461371 RepID=UPI0040463620